VAVGPRVAVVDVSDRARPVLVGESAPLAGIVMGIVLRGTYAYVATQAGFSILDISEPTRLQEVGSYGSGAHWVALDGDYAYLSGSGGFLILDVSDPTSPIVVGAYRT